MDPDDIMECSECGEPIWNEGGEPCCKGAIAVALGTRSRKERDRITRERDEARDMRDRMMRVAGDSGEMRKAALDELDAARAQLCAAREALTSLLGPNHTPETMEADCDRARKALAMPPAPCPHQQRAEELAAALERLQQIYRDDDAAMVQAGMSKRLDTEDYAKDVACWVKQLGASVTGDPSDFPTAIHEDGDGHRTFRLQDRKGADMAEWPADLRVRKMPEVKNA